ncbi:MAG: YtxH domain-containing protein [Bryobacterales bacterium]|nr:YtxH domain-containing protein [Acidobacteriota bacterium]MCB9385066.1 YtxH domain-containing protein [Bryobacterales bacterium]
MGNRTQWGPLLLGLAAGAAVGLLFAPEAPQRWRRKAKAGAARVREARGVLQEALEVIEEFRALGRPLDVEPRDAIR